MNTLPRLYPSHFDYLKALDLSRSGLTDIELAGATGKSQTCTRGRRAELVALGLCRKTEFTRTTPSGRRATVWEITDAGRRELISHQEKQNGQQNGQAT